MAKVPRTLTATMTLPDAGKATSTTPGPMTIPAGKSLTILFTFTPAQVQQELKSQMPIATAVEHHTASVQCDNKISELLPASKG